MVELQRAMQVMQRDLLQLVDRPIRDPLGDSREALLIQTDGTPGIHPSRLAEPVGSGAFDAAASDLSNRG